MKYHIFEELYTKENHTMYVTYAAAKKKSWKKKSSSDEIRTLHLGLGFGLTLVSCVHFLSELGEERDLFPEQQLVIEPTFTSNNWANKPSGELVSLSFHFHGVKRRVNVVYVLQPLLEI